MNTQFNPIINKAYFINHYTLIYILEGKGSIQIDFRTYHDWYNKILFLNKGQYIKFLSTSFTIHCIELPDSVISKNVDVRVLFKHLLTIGYINYHACEACKQLLSQPLLPAKAQQLIDISSAQWYSQNPFCANKNEYDIIFNIKDIIDDHYRNHLTASQLASLINQRKRYEAFSLVKQKLGISIKKLFARKQITESKREIAFTDKSIKEIAYGMGYKDPAYFSRVFKNKSGISPNQFRSDFDYGKRDSFTQELYDIIHKYHKEHRTLDFYANQMKLSTKQLSQKAQSKLNTSVGQLIRFELIHTAKSLLCEDIRINELAYHLGFEEANHFSSFFKHYTGQTPSQFKKYKQ